MIRDLPHPPARAERLLELMLGSGARSESILGDLFEEHADYARRAPARAGLWYWMQAVRLGSRAIASHLVHRRSMLRVPQPPSPKGDSLMRTLALEIRHAVRALLQRPALSAVLILTLALGLGANAAIFSIIDALVVRPYTMPDVDRIVVISHTRPEDIDRRETVTPADRRLAAANLLVALVALFGGVTTGLFQALGYAGVEVYSALAPVIRSHYHSLSIHGVLNALVWTTFFISGFLPFVMSRSLASPLASLRLGWLTFWLILVIVGILSTFGPSPSSIEGMLYTVMPMWFHIVGLPEVLIQSGLLAFLTHYWVNNPEKKWLGWVFGIIFVLVVLMSLLGMLAALGYLPTAG